MVPLTKSINIALAAVVIFLSATLSYNYWTVFYQPPTKYLSIAILNKDIHAGDVLVVRVTFDRRRNCVGTVDRFIVKLNGDANENEIVYRDTVAASPTPVGESISAIFRLKLPDDLKIGTYIYRSVARFDCNSSISTIEIPPGGFNVVADGHG